MKRTLLIIVIAMVGSLNAIAQEAESVQIDSTEISIDSLVVKLNTLQRNYDYLRGKKRNVSSGREVFEGVSY